jgi:ADP-ribose pyrophosphatase YjhB (NUDIX family)
MVGAPAEPQWLVWARELQAIAQNGLTFSSDRFDIERYHAVRAIAAAMMAAGSGTDQALIVDLFAKQSGYATPKVDVRGALFRHDRILLVRERSDGRWALPGGWADINQSASHAIIREIREESGFEASVRKLAAVYDRGRHDHNPPFPFHVYKMFFLCDITGGTAQPSDETIAVDFFPLDALPELSLGRVLPKQIARMFEHRARPDMPTDFD